MENVKILILPLGLDLLDLLTFPASSNSVLESDNQNNLTLKAITSEFS